MNERKTKVLIIGDELGLGEPLREAIAAAGFTVWQFTRPDEASSVLSNEKINYVFVDCMLAGVNGVDWVERLKENYPNQRAKIILMSGIYTDKAFIAEATKKTQAVAFLKKDGPFDYDFAIGLLQKAEEKKDDQPIRRQLYQIFTKEKVTAKDKKRLIDSLEEVSALDLPFIYSLLVETKSSGYLNIYDKIGNVSGVSFANGSIVSVDVEDKTTFLGEMLIQSGYVNPEDVKRALAEKTSQRLGVRLIQRNQLSPHAFDLVLEEQMNLRLSRTINDQQIKINFAATEVEASNCSIDSDQLVFFLHDWIASKISLSWLKSLYTPWVGNQIVPTPNFKKDNPILQLSLISSLNGLYEHLKNGTTINKLLEVPEYSETAVYKALHLLLSRGMLIISSQNSFVNEHEQAKALNKIWIDIKSMNAFELLERIGIDVDTPEMAKIGLDEFILSLGAVPAKKDSEAGKLYSQIKIRVEESVKTAGDRGTREQFKKKNESKDAEAKLRANQLLEEAKQILSQNQFVAGLAKLNDAIRLYPQLENIRLYLAWAKIGTLSPNRKAEQLKEIELELMQIPAEEKYDASYPFVLGLYSKAKGDIVGAKKSFEKALGLNPSMIAARREINLLDAQLRKQNDIDLKGFVSGLFGKKRA